MASLNNLIRCDLDCGCSPEYPRDLVKTGQYVICKRHGATAIAKVWASRWLLRCAECARFSGWYEERSAAVDAADAHHKRTVRHHARFLLEFRAVSRTGATRATGEANYTINEQAESLFDVPPPF